MTIITKMHGNMNIKFIAVHMWNRKSAMLVLYMDKGKKSNIHSSVPYFFHKRHSYRQVIRTKCNWTQYCHLHGMLTSLRRRNLDSASTRRYLLLKRCSVMMEGAEQLQGVGTLRNVCKLNKVTVMPTVTALNASDRRTSPCTEQFRTVKRVFVSAFGVVEMKYLYCIFVGVGV